MRRRARLDLKQVKTGVGGFPGNHSWVSFDCSDLRSGSGPKLRWKPLKHLQKKAGNYVFLLPSKHFKKLRTIPLDGPSLKGIKTKILFEFLPETVRIRGQTWAVLYVGKTTKLKQRFQWHLSAAKTNTGGQMQHCLVKCGLATNRDKAIQIILNEALLCYRVLDGGHNAANREMIEVGLWAKFNAPFNIKAER